VLAVRDNKLTNVDGLTGLDELKYLYLDGNKLTSLDPLLDLEELKFVYLKNTGLPEIAGVDYSKNCAPHLKNIIRALKSEGNLPPRRVDNQSVDCQARCRACQSVATTTRLRMRMMMTTTTTMMMTIRIRTTTAVHKRL
jgi:hypothetical protein